MTALVIGPETRVAAVIGWPVEHSRSPALHNAAIIDEGLDAVFVGLAVPPGRAAEAIRGMSAMGFLGASVTVPHKRAAYEACDRLAESARAVGAVNCLCFEDQQVIGHNTDASGFIDALEEGPQLDPAGITAAILGSGGAARAVAAGLAISGATEIRVVARTPEKVDWTDRVVPWTEEGLDEALRGCDLLVDCTSAGLSGEREQQIPAPIPLKRLRRRAVVSTLIYHRETALLREAQGRGLRTLDGAGMLVHQAARAFSLWTGIEPPVEAMWRAMRS